MPSISQNDRECLSRMQGYRLPAQHRDASNASARRDSNLDSHEPWKNPPTPIRTPLLPPSSDVPRTPYNMQRMRSGGQRHSSNPTATMRFVQQERQSKRRKLRHDVRTVDGVGTSYERIQRSLASSSRKQEIINVDEEDGPSEFAADPLNIQANVSVDDEPLMISSTFRPASSGARFIRAPSPVPEAHRSQIILMEDRIAKDGESTKQLEKNFKLKQKADTPEVEDSIEEFTSSPPKDLPGLSGFTPKIINHSSSGVREKIEMYNAKDHPNGRVRKIDLFNPPPSSRTKMKDQMKGKQSQGLDWTKQQDSFSMSGFPHQPRKTQDSKSRSFLPLQRLVLGTENQEGQWFLSWEAPKARFMSFTKGGPQRISGSLRLDSETHIKTVQCMSPQATVKNIDLTLFIQTSSPDPPKPSHGTARFKMGDRRSGRIIMKFDRNHPEWSNTTYDDLVRAIKINVDATTFIDQHGQDALWEATDKMLKSADEYAAARDRENCSSRVSRDRSVEETLLEEDSFPKVVEQIEPASATVRTSAFSREVSSSSRTNSRAIPNTVTNIPINVPTRRSTRQQTNQATTSRFFTHGERDVRESPPIDLEEVILCFPQGTPGAVNITMGDVKRLEPGEFLNDTLIEFGLKLWLRNLEESDPELANQIHVFSSFFYKKLYKKDPDEGYESVRKWTSKIDIFSKKYIIIPINENLHWYLAIIYHPEHVLKPPITIPVLDSPSARTRQSVQAAKRSAKLQPYGTAIPTTDVFLAETAGAAPNDIQATDFTESNGDTIMSTSIPEPQRAISIIPPEPSLISSNREASGSPDSKNGAATEMDEVNDMLINDVGSFSINDTAGCTVSVSRSYESPTPTFTEPSVQGDASNPFARMEVDEDGPSKTTSERAHSPTASEHGRSLLVPRSHSPMQDVEMAQENRDGIPPDLFYAKLPSSNKAHSGQPAKVTESISILPDDEADNEDEENITVNPASDEITYIFTLDSLGTSHKRTITRLISYLEKEAADKKGVRTTRKPGGKKAQVPAQPNFCDCGVYLLHFAETFMKKPDAYRDIILSQSKKVMKPERDSRWEHAKVENLREDLAKQIMQLSKKWKLAREQAKKEKEEKDAELVGSSSESELDIVEHTLGPTTDKAGSRKGGKGKLAKGTPSRPRG